MGRLVILVLVAAMMASCSRSGSEPAAPATPATVDHPRTEAELSTVKLTPEAVKRLGIETVTVRTEPAAATRSLGGEIVVPEGRGVVVTAPVAGTLTGSAPPRPGQRVHRGERLMAIAPLVATERDQRIEAQRAVTSAEAEELAARQRLQRLEQLLKDGAASVRSVEEARAQHQVTVAALTAARERLAGASRNPVGAQGELIVSAPFDGVVQAISAVPGQTVAASAPLLQLAQIDALWVRVPIYAGDARGVDEEQRATVRRLVDSAAPVSATRVTAPLQGDPSAASVDLYYALASTGGTLRPPRLMAIPGVANVAIWAQRDRQLQVLVDPDRLRAHGLTVDHVVQATGEGVSLQAGGFLDTPNQRLAITHATAVRSVKDLESIVVASRNGAALRVGDVATVVEGFPAPIGDAVINSGPGLMLIVEKQLGANTLTVTRGVEESLEQMKPALGGVAVDPTIFRPATFIEMSLENLSRALLVGCVLVILVLLVFLADWRTALISSIAIPLSLLAAGLLLHYRGGTLDTMVLAGLVIALGEVVDDAIIDVENIVRRLRLNRGAEHPQPAIRVILDASMEVRSAVLYGSLIVVVVFVPVFMLDGLAGAFFRPLALSYVLAILASLLVALTITPAMALLLLPRHLEHSESRLVGGLKARYRGFLPAFVDRPKTALGSLAALLLVTC